MTPREQLDAYAHEDPADGDLGNATRDEFAPNAFTALRAVLDLHKRVTRGGLESVCDECQDLVEIFDGRGGTALWPCPTVQVIVKAFAVSGV